MLDFSHQMLDLFSIGRTDDQRQLYDKIHIMLHDARQLDTEHQQPKLKKARMDYSRPMGVQAGACGRLVSLQTYVFMRVEADMFFAV